MTKKTGPSIILIMITQVILSHFILSKDLSQLFHMAQRTRWKPASEIKKDQGAAEVGLRNIFWDLLARKDQNHCKNCTLQAHPSQMSQKAPRLMVLNAAE